MLPPTLRELDTFLATCLGTDRFPADDPRGVWREPAAGNTSRNIARIGLALAPWPGLVGWVEAERLDALWLHRPWRLEETAGPLPLHLGVIAHHLAFDEGLTTGFNPRLAAALGLDGESLEPFGEKAGRPLGMIGYLNGDRMSAAGFARRTVEVFGGIDTELAPTAPVDPAVGVVTVAVVGAMNASLVRGAISRGAQIYVTGQWRQPAGAAVRETGIGVLAVGHQRAERWGLRALAGLLRERWPGMAVILASGT